MKRNVWHGPKLQAIVGEILWFARNLDVRGNSNKPTVHADRFPERRLGRAPEPHWRCSDICNIGHEDTEPRRTACEGHTQVRQ